MDELKIADRESPAERPNNIRNQTNQDQTMRQIYIPELPTNGLPLLRNGPPPDDEELLTLRPLPTEPVKLPEPKPAKSVALLSKLLLRPPTSSTKT